MQFDVSQVSKMFDQAEAVSKTLVKETYDYFVDATPERTGNAKRNTRLRGNTIDANYPYAERLDEGYSRQAPKGMSDPTEKFLEKRINDLIGKIK